MTKSMSPNRPTTQELEDWCEMLMRWTARQPAIGYWDSIWSKFEEEYPPVAAEMKEWLKRQHGHGVMT